MLLLRAWKNNDNDTSCILGALDDNATGLATRVHLKHHDKAYFRMRTKIANCYMLSAGSFVFIVPTIPIVPRYLHLAAIIMDQMVGPIL